MGQESKKARRHEKPPSCWCVLAFLLWKRGKIVPGSCMAGDRDTAGILHLPDGLERYPDRPLFHIQPRFLVGTGGQGNGEAPQECLRGQLPNSRLNLRGYLYIISVH